MSHDLDTKADGTAAMFYVQREPGDMPWHRLGTSFTVPPATAQEAMVAAGANWRVDRYKLECVSDAGVREPVPGAFCFKRSDTGKQLAVRSDVFTIIQNEDAFGWFDPLIKAGVATYETAGVLRGGRQVWVLAKLTEQFDVNGDPVDPYVLLANSHDGSLALSSMLQPIRVVCRNTLNMALHTSYRRDHKYGVGYDVKQHAVRIRHVPNAKEQLDQAREVLGLTRKQVAETAEAFRRLANTDATAARVDAFLEAVFPKDPEVEYHGVTEKKHAAVRELFEGKGVGADLRAARGTMWGLYNAVTELVDYGAVINGAAAKQLESRVNSMWQGAGQRLKQKALATALAQTRAA